jgi:hypothetical protein
MNKSSRLLLIALFGFLAIGLFIRLSLGIFVIQPIGAIPEGATIVYWRFDMNLPFIASADGLLEESGAGVSLLGRGMMLASVAEPITDREILRFGYSETLYLWSTDGKHYEK